MAGDPAVDVSKLLAHLRLRTLPARDGDTGPTREASLDGYGVLRGARARLDVYERATLLRLACVYAFRPRWGDALPQLLVDETARPRGR